MIEKEPTTRRYVVVTADDVGGSRSINRAVDIAVQSGIVTSISVMASGGAFREAVELVSRHPELSVGLHVVLSGGSSVLPHSAIPGLVDSFNSFPATPTRAGLLYWNRRRSIASQMADEVAAQFDRLTNAGLSPDHVDCHHHLHMHPLVCETICREAEKRGVTWMRMPREPISVITGLHFPLFEPRAFARWVAFNLLIETNLPTVHVSGLRSPGKVFGLSASGRMSEGYVLAMLPYLTAPANEIYFHPDLNTLSGRLELKTVTSGRVRERIDSLDLRLTDFRQLVAPIIYEEHLGRAG